MVILDTDHLTIIQRRAEPGFSKLSARLSELPGEDIFVTIISFEEQFRGWTAYISKVVISYKEVRV